MKNLVCFKICRIYKKNLSQKSQKVIDETIELSITANYEDNYDILEKLNAGFSITTEILHFKHAILIKFYY